MKLISLFILIIALNHFSPAQNDVKDSLVRPHFPGGDVALNDFLQKNLIYPKLAQHKRVHGVVKVQFIVEKDGSISHPEILWPLGSGCDEEALRVVRLMPNWIPGSSNGESIRFKLTQEIHFKLALSYEDRKKLRSQKKNRKKGN